MQAVRDVGGAYYLPRRDGIAGGVVEIYKLETSVNGTDWETAIDNGRFDNMRNNPILQEASFSPRKARYFRFTALKVLKGDNTPSAAEIGLMPTSTAIP